MDHDRPARIRALYEQIAKAHQQIEDEHAAALEDADAAGFSDGFTTGFAAGQGYAEALTGPDAATYVRGWFAGSRFERSNRHLCDVEQATIENMIQRIARGSASAPCIETEPEELDPASRRATQESDSQPARTAHELDAELHRAAAKVLPPGADPAAVVLFLRALEALPDRPTH